MGEGEVAIPEQELKRDGHRLPGPREAERFAAQFLDGLGNRWLHTRAVAAKAGRLAARLDMEPFDRHRIVNAAWLHDVGYAFPDLHPWHPIAGAMFLQRMEYDSIIPLVAWHSTAEQEAKLLGYAEELASIYREDSVMQDVIDLADMTTGPAGQSFTVTQRHEEVGRRHWPASTQYKAMSLALPRLLNIEKDLAPHLM